LDSTATDSATPRTRSVAVWSLLFLLLQGLGGLAGGVALVARPSGAVMHMPVDYLAGSPFRDYLIPGLILGLVLGAMPLVALAGVWSGRAWAWFAAFAVGCGLIIWIGVESLIIPFSALQPAFGTVGLLIAVATLAPSVRRYCRMRLLG
jgi:hypothetical protein